jgi:ABC-type microcin C transport system duplicated ATPase subunit YejF
MLGRLLTISLVLLALSIVVGCGGQTATSEQPAEHGLTYIFITHDLKIVKALCHGVIVMKSGTVVEDGPAQKVFEDPQRDYTRELLGAAFD